MKLDLTAEEADVLIKMLAAAIKSPAHDTATTFQAAETGLHFAKKIDEARKKAQERKPRAA